MQPVKFSDDCFLFRLPPRLSWPLQPWFSTNVFSERCAGFWLLLSYTIYYSLQFVLINTTKHLLPYHPCPNKESTTTKMADSVTVNLVSSDTCDSVCSFVMLWDVFLSSCGGRSECHSHIVRLLSGKGLSSVLAVSFSSNIRQGKA